MALKYRYLNKKCLLKIGTRTRTGLGQPYQVLTIDKSGADVKSRTCSSDSLKEEGRKFFVNIIFGNIGALLEVGIYSLLVTLEKSLVDGIEKKCERSDTNLYKEGLRDALANIKKK